MTPSLPSTRRGGAPPGPCLRRPQGGCRFASTPRASSSWSFPARRMPLGCSGGPGRGCCLIRECSADASARDPCFGARHDDDLDRLRNVVSRVVLMLIWLQAPLTSVAAYAAGNAWLQPGLASLALALMVTLAWWRWPEAQSTRLVIAVALIASLSLILAASAGSKWQVDLHMCYFAELAMLTAYCDRDVVLAGAVTAALHHLALNFLMPALVFPDGAQFGRVLLHAGILIIETAALVWLTHRITTLYASTAANSAAAVRALETARAIEAQAAEQRSLSEKARRKSDAELATAAETQCTVVAAWGQGSCASPRAISRVGYTILLLRSTKNCGATSMPQWLRWGSSSGASLATRVRSGWARRRSEPRPTIWRGGRNSRRRALSRRQRRWTRLPPRWARRRRAHARRRAW